MIETREKVIGSHRYMVRQLMSSEARKMLVRLTRVLGPVVGALAAEKAEAGISGAALRTALSELAIHLTDDDLEYVCRVFGEATQVAHTDGRVLVLDLQAQELHFAGKMRQMFEWIFFCLEVNFADFLGDAISMKSVTDRFMTTQAPSA